MPLAVAPPVPTGRAAHARSHKWLTGAVCAAALLLAGCARLNEKPPQAVDLSGHWQLRQSLSDDPATLLKPRHHDGRHGEDRSHDDEAVTAESRPDGDEGAQREPRDDDGMQGSRQTAGRSDRGGPELAMLRNLLAQPTTLSIQQLPGEISLTADGSPTRYVYGQDAIDSVQGGVAERTAGWSGDAFVIQYAVRQGPVALRSYRKDATGQWLTVTTRVHGGGAPKLEIHTVYERQAPG